MRTASRTKSPEEKYIALVRGLLLVYPVPSINPQPETQGIASKQSEARRHRGNSVSHLRDLVGGLSGRRAVGEPKLVLMLKAASGGTAVVGDGLERAEPALRPIPDSGNAWMPGFRRP